MNLYIIRHGDAVSEGERPLSERGHRESRQTALGLERLNVKPLYILHSPLARAVETAAIIAATLNVPSGNVVEHDLLAPGGDRAALLREIQGFCTGGESSIVLVGHLPDLGDLISYCIWGEPVKEVPLKKSSVTLLEFPGEDVRKSNGTLRWMLSTEHLGLIASVKKHLEDSS